MQDKTITFIGFSLVLVVFPAILFIFGADALTPVVAIGAIAIGLGLWLTRKFHIPIYEGRIRRY